MTTRNLSRPFMVLGLVLSFCVVAAPVRAQTPVSLVETGVAGFVGEASTGPLDEPVEILSFSDFASNFGPSSAGLMHPHLAASVQAFLANGGSRAYVVRVADASDASFIGVDTGVPGTRTGMQALLDVDEISIVAVPGVTSPSVQVSLIALCENAGDRIALLDAVESGSSIAVQAQRSVLGVPNGFATLYAPWVESFYDSATAIPRPPSGFVAGIWSRTAPWSSPVDAVLGVTAVDVEYTTSEIDALVSDGINPLRFIPGQGIRVWGARTLSSDPEWRYVAVRRTAHSIEESILEGLDFATSTPNDATLWAQMSASAESFLDDLHRSGAFQGQTANDAYFVRCDATTMTALDLQEGRTVMLVGFAPLRPAEFVLLRLEWERGAQTSAPTLRPAMALDAAPNPFNPRTELRFDLAMGRAVSLDAYDAAGRRVSTVLRESWLGAGPHRAIWNGSDDAGRRLASGVYTLVLRSGDERVRTRVTLVR